MAQLEAVNEKSIHWVETSIVKAYKNVSSSVRKGVRPIIKSQRPDSSTIEN